MHKNSTAKINLIITISLPWFLTQLLLEHPIMSFLIAFGGSFFIFYITILSPLRCIELDKSLTQQIMRPIVLLQLIFAGYMCCTSIFYFADHLGFEFLSDKRYSHFIVNEETYLLASCQRLVLLGHIALVMGLIAQLKTPHFQKYKISIPITELLVKLTLGTMIFAFLINFTPALIQFKYYLLSVSTTGQAFILILGLANKKPLLILFGGLLFVINLLNATVSGFKEILLINLITISFLAYPYFKNIITILFLPVLILLVYILPTLTTIVRKESWTGNKSPQDARAEAYETFASGRQELLITNNNWAFLTNRLSEIGMFSQYIKNTPDHQPYYGLQILRNSLYALVPRALWSQKPVTEKTSMERVYRAGVANRLSPVSAKTRTIIDGYLSAGLIGVFFTMLIYGAIAQWLCNKAEKLFGGYELGCMVIFNSIFQPLWRGNNWEFIINNMVYGFILMLLIFYILKHLKIIKIQSL
ncbi:hypothetical protein AAKU52_002496 [Pedobacter sp. CG_S7]|uniref:exosortase Y-associated Wzy-like protein n=1 Tax=Pedobacter sp. CG_S7 TaxID=3143930 RepID=UPI0033970FCD